MKLLLYCTKAKPYLYRQDDDTFKLENKIVDEDISDYKKYYGLNNGKIVAECDFEVEKITPNNWNAETEHRILKGSCLKEHQLFHYIIKGDENESQNPFYAIHIKNLHIFDKPKELNEYMNGKFEEWDYRDLYELEKAPQNMQYVSTWYCDEIDMSGSTYILISIKPEWLCKILNGEKTIEVRKKVLKEML